MRLCHHTRCCRSCLFLFIFYKLNDRSDLPIGYLRIMGEFFIKHPVPNFRAVKIAYFYQHIITAKCKLSFLLHTRFCKSRVIQCNVVKPFCERSSTFSPCRSSEYRFAYPSRSSSAVTIPLVSRTVVISLQCPFVKPN